jgi:hypothetical protein
MSDPEKRLRDDLAGFYEQDLPFKSKTLFFVQSRYRRGAAERLI